MKETYLIDDFELLNGLEDDEEFNESGYSLNISDWDEVGLED